LFKDYFLYPILSFFFFAFLLVWVLFFGLLGIPSFFLPKKKFPLEKKEVDAQATVCWIFFEKEQLTADHYEFESTVVAPFYDKVAFLGYSLLLKPVMWTLKKFNFLDRSMLFVVRRWIRIHRYIILGEQWVSFWEVPFTNLCTCLGTRVGKKHFFYLFILS